MANMCTLYSSISYFSCEFSFLHFWLIFSSSSFFSTRMITPRTQCFICYLRCFSLTLRKMDIPIRFVYNFLLTWFLTQRPFIFGEFFFWAWRLFWCFISLFVVRTQYRFAVWMKLPHETTKKETHRNYDNDNMDKFINIFFTRVNSFFRYSEALVDTKLMHRNCFHVFKQKFIFLGSNTELALFQQIGLLWLYGFSNATSDKE